MLFAILFYLIQIPFHLMHLPNLSINYVSGAESMSSYTLFKGIKHSCEISSRSCSRYFSKECFSSDSSRCWQLWYNFPRLVFLLVDRQVFFLHSICQYAWYLLSFDLRCHWTYNSQNILYCKTTCFKDILNNLQSLWEYRRIVAWASILIALQIDIRLIF